MNKALILIFGIFLFTACGNHIDYKQISGCWDMQKTKNKTYPNLKDVTCFGENGKGYVQYIDRSDSVHFQNDFTYRIDSTLDKLSIHFNDTTVFHTILRLEENKLMLMSSLNQIVEFTKY